MCELTIGMPVFNDIEFIEESLNSIMNQSLKDFQLIISDDGSTDGSEAICRKLAANDTRVTYIRQPQNLGISKNMEFLLAQAKTEFFMWAADDDVWDENYASHLIALLQKDETAIAAFCSYDLIDENGKFVENRSYDYSERTPYRRLVQFIRKADDGFGYGIFRTKRIERVKFPVWWWPNRKTAYNNIYGSLCYYLANGQYVHFSEKPLFFKRVKSQDYVNHVIAGEGDAMKETASFIVRKFNLVCFSFNLICKGNFFLAISTFPVLFVHWFVKPSFKQISLAGRSFYFNRILKRNR